MFTSSLLLVAVCLASLLLQAQESSQLPLKSYGNSLMLVGGQEEVDLPIGNTVGSQQQLLNGKLVNHQITSGLSRAFGRVRRSSVADLEAVGGGKQTQVNPRIRQLKALLNMQDDNRRFATVTIDYPVLMVKYLDQLAKNIKLGMFEDVYPDRSEIEDRAFESVKQELMNSS